MEYGVIFCIDNHSGISKLNYTTFCNSIHWCSFWSVACPVTACSERCDNGYVVDSSGCGFALCTCLPDSTLGLPIARKPTCEVKQTDSLIDLLCYWEIN